MSYPDAWGVKYTDVQSLAWLAYKGNGTNGTYNFPASGSDWNVVDVVERGSFRAVVVQGSKKVLSLSGTDDSGDWYDNVIQGAMGVSWQYTQAIKLARSTAPDIVVGHSLGGGMASYCAIIGGKCAATINAAPLNIVNPLNAYKGAQNGDLVINYVVPGEILHIGESLLPIMTKLGKSIFVTSKGGANLVSRHKLEYLDGFTTPVKK